MKNKAIIIGMFFIIVTLTISGCLDIFNSNDGTTTYQSHPTNIRYTISYGHKINCRGTGKYTINYNKKLNLKISKYLRVPRRALFKKGLGE